MRAKHAAVSRVSAARANDVVGGSGARKICRNEGVVGCEGRLQARAVASDAVPLSTRARARSV
eukprot:6213890-Pleurochrysis_carterae.AAC.1